MTQSAESRRNREWRPRSSVTLTVWTIAALLTFAGFIVLGNWQIRRLSWKLHLITEVRSRVNAPAVPALGPAQWPEIDAGHEQYLHVRVSGRFLNQDEILVRGTSRLGYGYWVMTPLRTARGFIVLINRGYIPSSLPSTPEFRSMRRPEDVVTITGLLRLTEPHGGFLRPNRPQKHQWYSRDVADMTTALGLPLKNVAPYFIDAAAQTDAHGWPVSGMTVIHFPNNHLGYAITWYVLAAMTLVGAAIGARHEWRSRH